MTAPTVLAVESVEAALEWWGDALGFTTSFVHRSPAAPGVLNYAVVSRDDVEVHLARRRELTDRRRAELTIVVADLDALTGELASRGVGASRRHDGALVVHDPSGNRLLFRDPDDLNPPR
ncbi:VOC family protein [Actinomarinicola tropica]|uniref:VOC domain-containing protein n=1 Tax=Actinomarinicola tropica TaxID=2789776 RepID=A0A5Q2RNP7_9ACTN|nr:VOC family protein [Actinomarinicola tropica]QGG95717.1 hypothetical protein GH723_11760 [Actinomarinicola tropica]